jgi:hypothetical protein
MIPPNTVRIPVTLATGITEEQFNAQIALLHASYDSVVEAKNAKLVIKSLWSDETVNSDTTVSGSDWVINAYGGLARFPAMTPDAYLIVLCHEMFHHLGGYPRMSALTSTRSWASAEGQADYGATAKCFKKIGADNDNYSRERAETASLILASVLASLDDEPQPSPSTPDMTVVSTTNEDHPAAQCRLDTYLAGIACNKPYKTAFSATSPIPGACSEENGETVGVRRRCWYAPRN